MQFEAGLERLAKLSNIETIQTGQEFDAASETIRGSGQNPHPRKTAFKACTLHSMRNFFAGRSNVALLKLVVCATVYIQMAVCFEWDESKNRTNIAKHGISFETAKLVFEDPHVVSFAERNVEGEERWQSLGSAQGIVILTVAHTLSDREGDEVIRIISARKASPSERRRYAL